MLANESDIMHKMTGRAVCTFLIARRGGIDQILCNRCAHRLADGADREVARPWEPLTGSICPE
ncbi:hypothetical protein GCM10009727_81050 [Actinomadura napierensis]|uniref:Uncharacterized protein n=1 Tax=Actinomadura napierensis TaxID=267854 RepID=A0ABP5M4U3_9ACTN